MALAGTRKRTILNKRRGGFSTAQVWLNRFGLGGFCFILFLCLGFWLYFAQGFAKTANWTNDQFLNLTTAMGFQVENIMVEGRVYTDPETLRAVLNVEKGDAVFAFHPTQAQELIKKIDWVKDAHVERRLPDTIYVALEERKPIALFQKDKKLNLVDEEGFLISRENLKEFKNLIIVMGLDSEKNAPALIKTLAAETEIFKRVRYARFVDQRRWDVVIDKEITLKLPEVDMGLALRRLAQAHDENGLLDKEILAVDLREPLRLVVRAKPGAAQEYKEYKAGFNANGHPVGNPI